MLKEKTYNGWANYQTWNIALWIENKYFLYTQAVEFMRSYKGTSPYKDYIKYMHLSNQKTLDGVKWNDEKLDYKALNEFMNEFKEH